MANVVLEGRVPRTQLGGILAVLVQMNGNGRIQPVVRKTSRVLFDCAQLLQQEGEREAADLFLEEAEHVSGLVEVS